MAPIPRTPPEETRTRVQSGKALLVCGYDSDEKFRAMHLEGGISLAEFRTRAAKLPKDQEIIFYCA